MVKFIVYLGLINLDLLPNIGRRVIRFKRNRRFRPLYLNIIRLKSGDEKILINNNLLQNIIRSQNRLGGDETRPYDQPRPPPSRILRLLIDRTTIPFHTVHPAADITAADGVNLVE